MPHTLARTRDNFRVFYEQPSQRRKTEYYGRVCTPVVLPDPARAATVALAPDLKVSHRRGAHDDRANALAGAVYVASANAHALVDISAVNAGF